MQRLSEKSVRKLRRQFPELDIEGVGVFSGGRILHCRTHNDDHYCLDRITGEVSDDSLGSFPVVHWTSCKTMNKGE